MGRQFAHQLFADSRESICAKRFAKRNLFLKRLARFAPIASSLRFTLKFAGFASFPRCYPFSATSILPKKLVFWSENRFAENIRDLHTNRESIRSNRPAKNVVFSGLPTLDATCHESGACHDFLNCLFRRTCVIPAIWEQLIIKLNTWPNWYPLGGEDRRLTLLKGLCKFGWVWSSLKKPGIILQQGPFCLYENGRFASSFLLWGRRKIFISLEKGKFVFQTSLSETPFKPGPGQFLDSQMCYAFVYAGVTNVITSDLVGTLIATWNPECMELFLWDAQNS